MDMLAAKYRLNPAAGRARPRAGVAATWPPLTASGYTSDRPGGQHLRRAPAGAPGPPTGGRGEETLQRLYEAHFAEGKSVFDTDALTSVAADAGSRPR